VRNPTIPPLTSSTVIRLDRVSKSFSHGGHKVRVLHGVSFTAQRGEITTIIGPSGSGKTTLLRIIGGLSHPDHGVVKVKNRDIYALSDRKLSAYRNREIGFIFQDYRLLPRYNAIENVMLPLMIAGLSRREQVARATRALRTVGLEAVRTRRVDHLSGGQEQRVGIARALARNPTVLIADEPTGNLDTARGSDIMQLFRTLRSQHGISIVMVTHDDQLAAQADHLIRIVDGRVREDLRAAA
jgi:putative ABC transport system ATP-binding protein